MLKLLIPATKKLTSLTFTHVRCFTAETQTQEVKYLIESFRDEKIAGQSPVTVAHELLRFTSQK